MAKQVLRLKASFLPPDSKPISVSLSEQADPITGRFSVLAVTTLEKLLLSTDFGAHRQGTLKLLTIDAQPETVIGAVFARIIGKFGREAVRGVRFEEANEITIHGDNSNVILDGETFRAVPGSPINLKPAQPLSFVKLAA